MKLRRRMNEKSEKILGIKDCRVNLIRISRKTIERMIGNNNNSEPATKNFNFRLKFNQGNWICVNHPDNVVPTISSNGTISISIHNSEPSSTDVPESSSSSPLSFKNKLRPRQEKVPVVSLKKLVPTTTISEISVSVQKNNLWSACKRKANKTALIEGSFVFAKQTGYAPWPSSIQSINKSRTSAIVKYYGFDDYKGTIKINELVQVDDGSMDEIGALILFTLRTKSIKEFERFQRAIQEIQFTLNFNL